MRLWCCVCAAGRVTDIMQVLSQLPQLQSVDFGHQYISGPLPPKVSFPSLEVLRLTNSHVWVKLSWDMLLVHRNYCSVLSALLVSRSGCPFPA